MSKESVKNTRERKEKKEGRARQLIETLKALGKNKGDILRAMVKSGIKIRDARRIWREEA